MPFSTCCHPYLTGQKAAATAESLMRSRFVAYALDDLAYIELTWDNNTRPEVDKLNFGGEDIAWQKLEIISTQKGEAVDAKGIVEFKAYYRKDDEDHVLHEVSRFVKSGGRWFYVDGVVKKVGKVIVQNNQGKNSPCPCGSGKKYKRCCGVG